MCRVSLPPLAELALVVVMIPFAIAGGSLFDQTFRPQVSIWAAKRIPEVRLNTIFSDQDFQTDLPIEMGVER